MKLTNSAEALPSASPQRPQRRARGPSRKASVHDPSVQIKVDSPTIESLEIPSLPVTVSPSPQSKRKDSVVPTASLENASAKDLLNLLTKPSEPNLQFHARRQPPFEPKMDREFCIYVPHTFEYLEPIFASRFMDARPLFSALTGITVPSSSHIDFSYLWWEFERRSLAYLPYVGFEKDFARGETLATRILGGNGGDDEWCRLEFGKDARNYGMNYASKWKLDEQDATEVRDTLSKKVDTEMNYDGLAGVGVVDRDGREDETWRPQKRRRRRR